MSTTAYRNWSAGLAMVGLLSSRDLSPSEVATLSFAIGESMADEQERREAPLSATIRSQRDSLAHAVGLILNGCEDGRVHMAPEIAAAVQAIAKDAGVSK